VILKSYIVERNIAALKKYQATLLYGENIGIKDDIKETIKKENKQSEIITFFEEDIVSNNILYENIFNQSLFSENKIIFIEEASDKILNQLTECFEKENKEIQIYIFANNLEKRSKLRNFFEKDKKLAIFACYEDNERTLINYVNTRLNNYKGLTGEIVNLIINNSNSNRKVIKNELIKIRDFFTEKKLNKDHVLELLNIKNDSGFDDIRDMALMGEKSKINKLLSETEILNDESFFYLNNLNYRILRLYEIKKISGENKYNYEDVLEFAKPPIFWKDKPIINLQLKKWSLAKLEEILIKIGETEILMKKNSNLRNDIIIKELIINLTNKASTTS
jgi:DNA polymerase III subunit delta